MSDEIKTSGVWARDPYTGTWNWKVQKPMADPNTTRRFADRFPNHPEAISGNVSEAFLDLLAHVHPDQDYPSEEAALLCRYAYDLGRKEGAKGV